MIELRKPTARDGAAIWQLVKDSQVLDLNSPYAYFLLGEHFSDTCVLAFNQQQLIGFVSGYIPPKQPNTLFCWQIAVDRQFRGRGIAQQLLQALLERSACQQVQYLQTTITPDNHASQNVFTRFAAQHDCHIRESINYFPEDYFPIAGHLAESLFCIGPLRNR